MIALYPPGSLENHIGVLGKTGSGKSNAAKVIIERLMVDNGRVCVLDPTGTWWGLRLAADGKKASKFKVAILGGDHGDIPISEAHGAVIGEAVGSTQGATILDTRQMRVGERTRFAAAFAESLLRTNRGPLTLVIDEAHLFLPQGRVADPASAMMLNAFTNLVSLGRSAGIRIVLISQRPAKVNKDGLTQIETLVAMRLIAPQDTAAIRAWVGEWADLSTGAEIVSSLPSLGTGDAWVWAPQFDFLNRVHFPLAATFDSGRPEANAEPRELPGIDAASIGAKMDAIRQTVLENDPARLKRRIAELEKQKGNPDLFATKRDVEDAYAKGLKIGGDRERDRERRRLGGIVLSFAADFALAATIEADTPAPSPRLKTAEVVGAIPADSVLTVAPGGGLDLSPKPIGPERAALAVLVRAVPGGYTEAQWATLAGYKRNGGTWGTYKSRLRSSGRIRQNGDLWYATQQGLSDVGDTGPAVPGPGPELVRFWAQKIGATKVAEALIAAYPESLTSAELAERIGMSPTGGSFGTYLSRLRSNKVIEQSDGMIRIADHLMGAS